MKSIIDQTLGDVFILNASCRFESPAVDDAFVRASTVVIHKENGVMRAQTLHDIVRIQNRDFRCFLQTLRAHHRDVHPRDEQDARAAVWRRADWADRLGSGIQRR